MFIDSTMNPRPALQRSAMFPALVRERPAYVSLLWSEEEFSGGRVFYKHYVPTGRGKLQRKILV
jgi:hypothetical protein